MSNQKKLFWQKSLKLLIPFMLIAGINYYADPAHLFIGDKYEREIAALLIRGVNVASSSEYDERLVQKYYIQGVQHRLQIVALGSSRVMQVNSKMFPKKSFHNNSVSSASLQDLMAFYEMYYERGFVPSVLILELDPAIIQETKLSVIPHSETIQRGYDAIAKRLGLPLESQRIFIQRGLSLSQKYSSLFSPSYFQISCLRLLRHWRQGESFDYSPTDQQVGYQNITLADGSLSYGKQVRERSPDEVLMLASKNLLPYEPGKINQNVKKSFETFVQTIKRDGVQPVFFLAPLHPFAYNHLKEKNIDAVEAYFREAAQKNHVPVIGSYDPVKAFVSDTDFYDGMHPKREAVERIFLNALRTGGESRIEN